MNKSKLFTVLAAALLLTGCADSFAADGTPAAVNEDSSLNSCDTQNAAETAESFAEEESVDSAAETTGAEPEIDPYFEEMTAAELYAYYCIAPLPETLAGLTFDRCNVDFSIGDDQKPGIVYQNADKEKVWDDCNLFWYYSADGSQVLRVEIEYQRGKAIPAVNTGDTVPPEIIYGWQDDTTETAYLNNTGELSVIIYAENMTHEQLEEAAQILRAAIIQ